MKLIIEIFLSFLKIGSFSFGGGYAMLPLIQREVVNNKKWIDINTFKDIIGISQMTPGPIAINSATFVGFKISGVRGSIAGTFGVILTSFILVTIVSHYTIKFKESKAVKAAFLGMRPALVGLIIAVCIELGMQSYLEIKAIIIGIIIGILLFATKINPILIIIISGLLGILFYGVI